MTAVRQSAVSGSREAVYPALALTVKKTGKYSLSNMRKWFTSFMLIVALGSGVVGISVHEGEGSSMANMPDCCRKAHSAGNTAEVSMARLCCNLNCSEPGTGGGSNASTFSSQPSSAPAVGIVSCAMPVSPIKFSFRFPLVNTPHGSNPKYIQHLALLI